MRARRSKRPTGTRRGTLPTGLTRWALSGPLLLFLAAFTVFPTGLGLWISLTDRSVLRPTRSFVGLANFQTVLTDDRFWQSLWFTLRFTAITTAAVLITGFALALLMNRRFPGKRVLFTVMLLPIMIAPALMGLMFRLSLNADIGIVPEALSVIGLNVSLFDPNQVVRLLITLEVLQWTPFAFLILYSGLQALPTEIFEAADVDGTNAWQRIRYITIPLMAPVFFAAGFLRAIDALRTFDVIFVLTGGGPGRITTTMSIYVYRKAFVEGAFGVATAAGVVIMLLTIPLVPFIIRRVVIQPGDVK